MAYVNDVATRTAEAIEALRSHGTVFAYLHDSRATNTARPASDIDIAAYSSTAPPSSSLVESPCAARSSSSAIRRHG
jgi:predicted nucleotidyltransferase